MYKIEVQRVIEDPESQKEVVGMLHSMITSKVKENFNDN